MSTRGLPWRGQELRREMLGGGEECEGVLPLPGVAPQLPLPPRPAQQGPRAPPRPRPRGPLQQLLGPVRAGPGHQPQSGLVQEQS